MNGGRRPCAERKKKKNNMFGRSLVLSKWYKLKGAVKELTINALVLQKYDIRRVPIYPPQRMFPSARQRAKVLQTASETVYKQCRQYDAQKRLLFVYSVACCPYFFVDLYKYACAHVCGRFAYTCCSYRLQFVLYCMYRFASIAFSVDFGLISLRVCSCVCVRSKKVMCIRACGKVF